MRIFTCRKLNYYNALHYLLMTKVVAYLFDSMFQGKNKISLREKIFVVCVAMAVLTSVFIFLF